MGTVVMGLWSGYRCQVIEDIKSCIHSPKKETPRLFNLKFKKCNLTLAMSPTCHSTPSGHFKICKWKGEEFLYWASVYLDSRNSPNQCIRLQTEVPLWVYAFWKCKPAVYTCTTSNNFLWTIPHSEDLWESLNLLKLDFHEYIIKRWKKACMKWNKCH